MQQSADHIGAALARHERFMYEWLERFTAALMAERPVGSARDATATTSEGKDRRIPKVCPICTTTEMACLACSGLGSRAERAEELRAACAAMLPWLEHYAGCPDARGASGADYVRDLERFSAALDQPEGGDRVA